jgi:BTB/POZ domain
MNPSHLLLARTPPTPSHPATDAWAAVAVALPSLSVAECAWPSRASFVHQKHSELLAPPPPASGTPVASPPPPAAIEIHPTFLPTAPHPGTVLLVVESTRFYVHRDLLIFASSFFECLFRGDWRETASDTASTHVDDKDPRRLSVPSSSRGSFVSTDTSPLPDKDPDTPYLGDDDGAATALADLPSLTLSDTLESNDGATVSISSFADEMEGAGVDMVSEIEEQGTMHLQGGPKVEAKIFLREEKAAAVHDALHFIYPQ